MKLLDQIVDLLSDKGGSLTDALLKTKVLLHKIGHKDLVPWVDNELNGYPNDTEIPPYREVQSALYGVVRNHRERHSRYPLPTNFLGEEMEKMVRRTQMRESIAVLEQYAYKRGNSLMSHLPADLAASFNQVFQGAWVESAWTQIEISAIDQLLIEVRSRLLEFILEVQSGLGETLESEMKEAGKAIDAGNMFRSAVFGDNTTIVVGDSNKTSVRNFVKKGDFGSLAAMLREKGIAEPDIAALQVALHQDQGKVDFVGKRPGPSVKSWMGSMMQKAIDAAWNIELGVAGGLLTNAVQAYYFS